MGISNDKDERWGVPDSEGSSDPTSPTAYAGGVLAADPLAALVTSSPDRDSLVAFLVSIGYKAALPAAAATARLHNAIYLHLGGLDLLPRPNRYWPGPYTCLGTSGHLADFRYTASTVSNGQLANGGFHV